VASTLKYMLRDDDPNTPVPVEDALTWATWFETADRSVALTRLTNDGRAGAPRSPTAPDRSPVRC
jgi:hypothetical protein